MTTFHQEWILSYVLLQYTLMVSTHNDELRHIHWLPVWKANICRSEVFCATVIAEEIPTCKLGEFSCTTWYIMYLIVSECAPFTYVVYLSNLENLNVQHGFSCKRKNYQSLEDDYWDRYNATETMSCRMILATLVYMDMNINVSKYQTCGCGETKDLVDNILSARELQRDKTYMW